MSLRLAATTLRGLDAISLEANGMRVVMPTVGLHIGELCHTKDGISPMWQPHWKAADSSKIPTDGAATMRPGWIMAKRYGGGPDSSLLAGIVGHNICIDRFGAAWPGEAKPIHGEAGCLPWSSGVLQGDGGVRFTVDLPEAGLSVARSFKLLRNEVVVSTTVAPSNRASAPQPIEWCEHATIGDPFLAGSEISAGVDQAWNSPEELHVASGRFYDAGPLTPIPVEDALAMPKPGDPPVGDVLTTRVVEGWFEAKNEKLGKVLRYEWDRQVFPWLCLWTEHNSRKTDPWKAKTRSRGMEFSSKAFPEGKPPPERETEFHGVPTTCIVPPEGLTTSFRILWNDL